MFSVEAKMHGVHGLDCDGFREFAMLLSVGRGFGYGFSLESLRDYLQGMLISIQRVSQDSITMYANSSSFLKDFSWQEGVRLLAMSLALRQNVVHDRSFDHEFGRLQLETSSNFVDGLANRNSSRVRYGFMR